ncbi:Uncharacterized conserved protein, contains HEPN domain [Rheinheimera pacifica]|uniref:Uncharacterized conserved protein, contains HEPN domain n=1 Tax=Rheinheimera pacifica TaxID=173990 RepID=A0A1H6LC74_9GAMM|nr:DUF86 domain-containing protein [Rheinheimera pacifica]SEH85920.1 Uncharacterized conserved protein, contains HEPN domain [Rheinheimera pacifica]
MTSERILTYVEQMLESVFLACSYIEGLEKSDFLADKKTQQAVVLNLLVLGETATKILQTQPDFASQHTDIPWRSMKGMRNRIAHGYFDINLDVVWDTTKQALPQLHLQLKHLVSSLN